jgi:glyoxylase-like metal-dependent hydrolase (beta-lactamase superfamily II)
MSGNTPRDRRISRRRAVGTLAGAAAAGGVLGAGLLGSTRSPVGGASIAAAESSGQPIDFCGVVQVAPNTLVVGGLPLDLEHDQPDVSNTVVYRAGDTIYFLDSGATPKFRRALLDAARSLGPVTRAVLINSHGHVDHNGNNDLLADLDVTRREHYISVRDIVKMPGVDFFVDGVLEGAPYFPVPNPVEQFAAKTFSLFQPYNPSVETVTPLERLPLDAFEIGGVRWSGWRFGEDVYVLRTFGHTPGSVMIYLPGPKLLFAGDETTAFFPVWPDGDSVKIFDVFLKVLEMTEHGGVQILIESHNHHILRGGEAVAQMRELVDNYVRYEHSVHRLLAAAPNGLVLEDLLQALRADPLVGPDRQGDSLFWRLTLLNKLRELRARQSDTGSPQTRFSLP